MQRSSSSPAIVFPFSLVEARLAPAQTGSHHHIWRRLWERRCHGSRTILIPERRKQGDEVPPVVRGLSPPIPPGDVAIAPAGANHDVPAPPAAAPATALEVAELRGQMQQLTGVCLALQAQLAGAAAPAVSLPREQQGVSSHRRSRIPLAPQEQQADSPHRSLRAPSEERAPERRGRSPRRSVASPRPPRSVVGGNSHNSGRGGPANSEQELARRLRRVVDLEHRMDAMVQRVEGKAPAEDDLDFRSPFSREILEAQVSSKLPLPTIAPYDGTTDPADHIHGFESHMASFEHQHQHQHQHQHHPHHHRQQQQQQQQQQHNAAGMVAKETAIQALNTIIQLHFEKTLEKKRAVDLQKKELWKLFQLFFLFLALVFSAQVQSSPGRLQCRHCWTPITLLSLGHLIFYVAVAQTLRCINGFKYQRRCHKLTLALATDRLKQLKMRGPAQMAADGEEEDQLLEVHYQEPPESYLSKFKRNWALHFGFLICTFAFTVSSSVVILCF
ncbi:hypothetical protein Taro_049069 [Colocasia esculenta]|uniref:Uncharacterized protein n=1 Tax=Colocasia esculenta TaxID=4460 RepID=A0A843X9S5_COLES|nr:hypothetical protein [Colocasia esculenta]